MADRFPKELPGAATPSQPGISPAGGDGSTALEERARSRPIDVLSTLDIVVLDRLSPRRFRAWGAIPDWLKHWPGFREDGTFEPGPESEFLDNFLYDAEEHWAASGSGFLRSGSWTETRADGSEPSEFNLEAFAMNAGGAPILAIELLDEAYQERQHLLQRARETTLSLDDLRREIQKKEVLLHCIVHDLRGPLTGIVGALSLVLSKDPVSERRTTLLEMGLKQARHQDAMIRRILEVFAAEIDQLESFHADPESAPDLVDTARETVERQTPAFLAGGLGLVFECDLESALVVGRRDRLERVLTNLLDNALRYGPKGSEVRVRVSTRGSDAMLEVEDEGPGVPPNRVSTLFARFTSGRDKPGAAGLGLYFCRITTQQWGGDVGYAPRGESGARFWVRLPLVIVEAS